ncbi:hypothetical protein FQN60_007233 [Etheostoma spectabile]|uniref:Uncharacterized protein n=1 Tax=Etheostoma spectabile TaxID=54343 RepID=A0A5J5CD78_9PERO|nr:hypothetical protein FQN60_007233 [Etheostoma spectabile]
MVDLVAACPCTKDHMTQWYIMWETTVCAASYWCQVITGCRSTIGTVKVNLWSRSVAEKRRDYIVESRTKLHS